MKTQTLLTLLLASVFAHVAQAASCEAIYNNCFIDPDNTQQECQQKLDACNNPGSGLGK